MKRGPLKSPVSKGSKRPKLHGDYDQYFSLNTTYYKNPITCERANEFNNGKRKKPIDFLNGYIATQGKSDDSKTIIHWFRGDLRTHDNTGLFEAIKQFRERKDNISGQLLTIFTINEHDWRAHMDSGWKLKFMMNAVSSLGEKLSKMSIPLHVLHYNPESPSLSNSNHFASWLKEECLNLAKGSGPVLLTANAQYETDELYRDIKMFEQSDSSFKFKVFHDACVIEPKLLTTGKGTQYTVFTPWYKKWAVEATSRMQNSKTFIRELSKDPVKDEEIDFKPLQYELPSEFLSYIPEGAPELPEASEDAAFQVLSDFSSQRAHAYDKKDYLPDEGSSHLSCYITSGLISARYIVSEAAKLTNGALAAKDIKKNSPVQEFIREVAWRDFYKHAFCNWPFLSMDLPYSFELNEMKWSDDQEAFKKWCEGETGVPIVDAIMRKLLCTGFISNRARMITASFLCKNLLLDYRWGERWFRKHLIDFDLASNVGGWGFCSSTGIDAQPYFRILNMELQSKKFDPEGRYIRKWVPELKDCKDVHTFNLERNGYQSAIVDYKKSRERALATYRQIL
ncbi:hypothetical protein HG537_0E00200 [Torulaspora globosa]|uniref:Photolyase/cryptochrome alpha/beta domain-containing protein n=1 Tax=Torulaspora globosa TaxID=48254 RepID=A0A7H9HV81_9SACH|nr:hypothetical protein HG537_0E00200 [Torulaspora sp. CBS 2947]